MKPMTTHKTVFGTLAVLAALALPMVAGAADKLIVQDGTIKVTSAGNPKVTITDTGYIGLGLASPAAPVHSYSSGNNNTTAAVLFQHTATGATPGAFNAPNLSFYRNNDGTASNGALPRGGDSLGFFNFGSVVSSPTRKNLGMISVNAEGVWNTTIQPVYFSFLTTGVVGGVNVLSEKLRISSSGNVGIGTTGTPTSKLQVVGILEYADNAAALAAGLTVGAVYRTGDVLKIVH